MILIYIQPHLCLPKEIFLGQPRNLEVLFHFGQSGKEERLAVPGGQEERRDDGGRGRPPRRGRTAIRKILHRYNYRYTFLRSVKVNTHSCLWQSILSTPPSYIGKSWRFLSWGNFSNQSQREICPNQPDGVGAFLFGRRRNVPLFTCYYYAAPHTLCTYTHS